MRRAQWVLVVLAALLVAALSAAVVMKANADDRAARRAAASYSATPDPSASPSRTAASDVVSVISDELALSSAAEPKATPWPILVEQDTGVDLISMSSGGSGYIAKPSTATFGGTFTARAQEVSPSSRAVLFFGGIHDMREPRATIEQAAGRAFAAAKAAAPDAQIIVIGPTTTTLPASDGVLRVRAALQSAASRAKVRFVDPIAAGWLTKSTGLIGDDGASLTEAGQRAVAQRIIALIEPLLR